MKCAKTSAMTSTMAIKQSNLDGNILSDVHVLIREVTIRGFFT